MILQRGGTLPVYMGQRDQRGGTLPVYIGRRHQRGGNILSSFARLALPMIKNLGAKLFGHAVKAAPSAVGSVISNMATPRQAFVNNLKTAGKNTAIDTLGELGFVPKKSAPKKSNTGAKRRKITTAGRVRGGAYSKTRRQVGGSRCDNLS